MGLYRPVTNTTYAWSERGVAPVTAVILLVAITVIAAATLWIGLVPIASPIREGPPKAAFSPEFVENGPGADDVFVTLTNGPGLDASNLSLVGPKPVDLGGPDVPRTPGM